jgi:hypothetical protein
VPKEHRGDYDPRHFWEFCGKKPRKKKTQKYHSFPPKKNNSATISHSETEPKIDSTQLSKSRISIRDFTTAEMLQMLLLHFSLSGTWLKASPVVF